MDSKPANDKFEEKKKLINENPDFINYPNYNNSLKSMLSAYPNGLKDTMIAKALCITAAEVETAYQQIVLKLKKLMKVD